MNSVSLNIKCEFINHASFLITDHDLRLVTDPWFQSDVFNKGWNLLFEDQEISLKGLSPTAIWLSHEHPDHFNIPTLKSIPVGKRNQVSVYLRATSDKRVGRWCKENGFNFIECNDQEIIQLSEQTQMTVFSFGVEDSAALFNMGGTKFLNLNDCLFPSRKSAQRYAKRVGHEDYVGYLCGYAEGGGTRLKSEYRKQMARAYQERFDWIRQAFPMAKVCGFAAFKYFSQEENFFQNDQNLFGWLESRIRQFPNQVGLVAPGDQLQGISPMTSARALEFWVGQQRKSRPIHHSSTPFLVDVLRDSGAKLEKKFLEGGGLCLILEQRLPRKVGLRPIAFLVSCGNVERELVQFPRGSSWRKVKSAQEDYFVSVSFDALSHALTTEYGLSTLLINGRFESNESARINLYRWSMIGLIKSSNQRLGPRFFVSNFNRMLHSLLS